MMTAWEPTVGSDLVFIIPFGIMNDSGNEMINEILERVLAISFSGIHKSNIICSA
jgi:hypothetical protein